MNGWLELAIWLAFMGAVFAWFVILPTVGLLFVFGAIR